MRREKVGKIVTIGQGLCRVIVRSEKLADRLASIPGVQVRAEDTDHLGWWVIFPEEMRPLMEPVFRGKIIVTDRPVQLSLIDEAPLPETEQRPDNVASSIPRHEKGK